jgi:hypothetical protein
MSDNILLCNNNPSNCQEDKCIEGTIGPLCESCDILKVEWPSYY